MKKFNFGHWKKYHKIQFFGILLAVLIVALCLDVITVVARINNMDNEYANSTAIFNDRFVMSLSGAKGNIKYMFSNKDKTKCIIMLQFDDITQISTDAKDYRIFYHAYSMAKNKYVPNVNHPRGGFYMFGNTGYAMIYLNDVEGFKSQPVEIICRSRKLLTEADDDDGERLSLHQRDTSYSSNDQCVFFVNPGSPNITVVDYFNDDADGAFDAGKFYQKSLMVDDEMDIRERLEEDIKQMNENSKKIKERKSELERLNIIVPDVSYEMIGDSIEVEHDVKTIGRNEETDQVEEQTKDILVLKLNENGYVYNGTVHYDWFHNTLETKSFLNEEAEKAGKSPSGYLDMLQSARSTIEYDNQDMDKWQLVSGEVISLSDKSASNYQNDKAMATSIQNYITPYREYLTWRRQYFTQDLIDYLMLDYNVNTTGNSYTSVFTYEPVDENGNPKFDDNGNQITYPAIYVWD